MPKTTMVLPGGMAEDINVLLFIRERAIVERDGRVYSEVASSYLPVLS